MNVAVLGGTGFIGSYIVDALLAAGHRPVLLVRSGSTNRVRMPGRCRIVTGTVDDPGAVDIVLTGCDAAVYAIGIIRPVPRHGITYRRLHVDGLVRVAVSAREHGADRFLLISANGASPDGTPYQQSKFEGEQRLRDTGLSWTVLRPSLVYGDPRGRMDFMTQLRDTIVRMPIPAPRFFGGGGDPDRAFRFAPVHVTDLAALCNGMLENGSSAGRTVSVGGPEIRSWRDLIDNVASVCGRRKWFAPAPLPLVRSAANVLDRFRWFPVTAEQLTMLADGNVCEPGPFGRYGITPKTMNAGTLDYLTGNGG